MELLYDFLCNAADIVLKKHNPCRFNVETGKCRVGRANGCCVDCPYLGETGCTAQSLACKLFLCSWIEDVSPELNRIRDLASQAGLMEYHMFWGYARLDKQEFFAYKRGEDVHANRPDIYWRDKL